ncbi:hypothetical protein PS2_043331 [Malus domestica]
MDSCLTPVRQLPDGSFPCSPFGANLSPRCFFHAAKGSISFGFFCSLRPLSPRVLTVLPRLPPLSRAAPWLPAPHFFFPSCQMAAPIPHVSHCFSASLPLLTAKGQCSPSSDPPTSSFILCCSL